ncbi:MAG: PssE/Cps14G family polysaccharide biosynthesis glycosyltransferase [Bacilli bacterium]|nr:PssE/Cps14G family polysaccharide biosynthesis glycosyltransferase [Bacilli bacterium]
MILVILGTQDKQFPRLLEAIDKEIEKGTIKDKVIVQAGQTKYESNNMEILGLLPEPEFDKLMDEADLIITHGGAGTILSAIKKGKRVIACARLAKYKEHHNDHQKQIIKEFSEEGYILELKDFNKLDVMIEKSKNFKPKKFTSNTENMIKLLDNYIEKDNHTSWLNRSGFILRYFIVLAIYTLLYYLVFELTKHNKMIYSYHFIPLLVFLFPINKYFVYKNPNLDKGHYIIMLPFYFLYSFMLYIITRYDLEFITFNISFFIITLLINRLFVFGDIPEKLTNKIFGEDEED